MLDDHGDRLVADIPAIGEDVRAMKHGDFKMREFFERQGITDLDEQPPTHTPPALRHLIPPRGV
jgi:hypothetical protein